MASIVERLKQEPDGTIILRGSHNYIHYNKCGNQFRIDADCEENNVVYVSVLKINPFSKKYIGLYGTEICSECDVLTNINLVIEEMKKEIMIGIVET